MLFRRIRWFITNGLAAFVLYLATVKHVAGAERLLTFWICFLGLVSLSMLSADMRARVKALPKSFPPWVEAVHDIAFCCWLVWFGWVWMAAIWTISQILFSTGYGPAKPQE